MIEQINIIRLVAWCCYIVKTINIIIAKIETQSKSHMLVLICQHGVICCSKNKPSTHSGEIGEMRASVVIARRMWCVNVLQTTFGLLITLWCSFVSQHFFFADCSQDPKVLRKNIYMGPSPRTFLLYSKNEGPIWWRHKKLEKDSVTSMYSYISCLASFRTTQ